MKKPMMIVLFTLLCMSFAGFAGCKGSDGYESQQPDIEIGYEHSNSIHSDAENNDSENELSNIDNDDVSADSENDLSNPANDDVSADSGKESDSEYELASFGNSEVYIIPGKKNNSGETNIHGAVLSIGKYTVTLNKAFTAEYTPDGKYIDANTMVSYEEPNEQVIEFVQFTEESTFTLRETRNNGADGKDSPASFDDIKTGDLLDIRGCYIDGLFNAENTIIYRNLDIQK